MRTVLVGEYIKSHREKQGITQEELCAGICSKSTLSRLERGKQTSSTPCCTAWACRRTASLRW